MKKKNFAILALSVLFSVTACSEASNPTPKPDNPNVPVEPEKPVLKQFENLAFEGKSITYDGNSHSLEVKNLPDGATVEYTNNDKKSVGNYDVTAKVSKEGYETKTLTAKLIIIAADMQGIVFEGDSFEFDDKPHTVSITGSLPEGSIVTYSCKEDATITNTIQKPGKYTIKATITNDNYNKVEIVAVFNITSKEELRHITKFGDKIYFQNTLDKDRLYSYDTTNGVKKINNNKPQYFTSFQNKLYYRSDSSLAPAIVALESTNQTTTILPNNAEYICDDEQYIYYSDNSMFGENGIYRLSITESNIVPQKLYDGKSYFLQVIGDNIYFADGKNSKKLSSIRKDLVNQTTATLVVDHKIKELTSNSDSLFYTVNNLAGDYISQYKISSNKETKLTSDAGKYLTVANNELYYVNGDLLNSNLFGKGIYKTAINIAKDSSKAGVLAIASAYKDYPISSLYYDCGNLYFYESYTKKLYSYNTTSEKLTDLLKDFVVPEDSVLLAKKGAVCPYGDKVYYQNQYDNNNLYLYDPKTGSNVRITSTAVDDLYIYKDYLYYRQVSYFVNKDLYRVNIKTGGQPEEISKEDCGELEIFDDKIYYTNYSGVNEIHMMNLDGSEDKVICKDGAYNLRVYNNKLYFIVNAKAATTGYIHYIDLNDPTLTDHKIDKIRTSYFEINNDKIYLRHLFGLAYAEKELAVMDLDGKNLTTVQEKRDPNSFVIVDDVIYYNNDVTGSYSVNSFNLKTNEDKVIKKEVYASNIQYVNGKLYYQSYLLGGTLGDGHFYELALDGTLKRIE